MRKFFQKLVDPFPRIACPLVVADVGSTGGPDRRWEALESGYFYWFDPSPESVPADSKWKGKSFPIGLWSKKEKRELYLMRNPQASSLFKMSEGLQQYWNAPCHECVGKIDVALDALDRVLEGQTPPDFLKIDAEGADLEILKGSEGLLKSSILGVQVESSFVERHQGGALFAEVDHYLRKLGFELADVHLERWVRKNGFHTPLSRAQVVWGDCLYLVSKEEALRRGKEEQYRAILMVHRLHDRAKELGAELGQIERQGRSRGWKLLLALTVASVYGIFRREGRHYRKEVMRRMAEWLQNRAVEEGVVR